MPYTFDGNPQDIASEPQLKDGTRWVPLRAVAASMGANADWDSSNQVAILYAGNRIVTIKIGDANVDIDGSPMKLQAAPYLQDGETWVPVRLFSEGLGYNVGVDLASKTVDISSPAV
jgi:hypothetical protein